MNDTLYDRIKALRIEAGMTQGDLAAAVGYKDKSMISKIESGKIDISGNKIMDFAEALGTTPRYLMDGEEEKKEKDWQLDLQRFGEKPPDDDIRLLIRGLNKLTPEQITQAKNVFRAMFAATNPDLFDEEK